MRINYNAAAASGNRLMRATESSFSKATERLSTGLRINHAADDAAGLFFAEKLRAQAQGLNQASRNAQDGISYLQTAEGGLSTIADQIARARELAVQAANGVFQDSDRAQIQTELEHIKAEIDRITGSTSFNGKPVFNNQDVTTKLGKMLESLRRSALKGAEELLAKHYGLTGDGALISIATIDDPAAAAALATMGPSGSGLQLTLNLAKYDDNFALPDGGTMSTLEFDRVIAHEMTHGVMFRRFGTAAMAALPDWFVEGTAEYIHGADVRLKNHLDAVTGGAGFTLADVVSELGSDWDSAAPTGGREYSIGYAAVKYIDHLAHQRNKSIVDVMDALEGGASLDVALTNTVGMNTAAFITDFEGVNGQSFMMNLNLTDSDVGGVGGGDETATVPDYALEAMQPLEGFNVSWPAGYPEGSTRLQVGANNVAEDGIMLSSALISADAIDLESLDVTTQASALEAIDHLDRAVVSVASTRAGIGAVQAKLEYALTQLSVSGEQFRAAESRVRDLDAAAGISEMVRQQILRDSALSAISLAHANNSRILPLLQFGAGQQGDGGSSSFALAA